MENIELLKKVIKADMDATYACVDSVENPNMKKQLTTEAGTLRSVLLMLESEDHLHEMARVFGIE